MWVITTNKFTVSHSQINSNPLNKDSESPNLSLRSVFPTKRLQHRIILATIHIPLEVTHPSTKKVTSSQPLGVSLVPEYPGKRHVDPGFGLKVYGLRVETMYCALFEERTLTCRSTTHHASQRNLQQSGSLQFVQMRNYSNFKDGHMLIHHQNLGWSRQALYCWRWCIHTNTLQILLHCGNSMRGGCLLCDLRRKVVMLDTTAWP